MKSIISHRTSHSQCERTLRRLRRLRRESGTDSSWHSPPRSGIWNHFLVPAAACPRDTWRAEPQQ